MTLGLIDRYEDPYQTRRSDAATSVSPCVSQVGGRRDPSEPGMRRGLRQGPQRFVVGYYKRYNRPSTVAETERLLRVYFLPVWQNQTSRPSPEPTWRTVE